MKTQDHHPDTTQRQPAAAAAPRTEAADAVQSLLGEGRVQRLAPLADINQSPRMLAQRRALQAGVGEAFQRKSVGVPRRRADALAWAGKIVQRASPVGTQDVLLRVDNVAAKQAGKGIPDDGVKEKDLCKEAIDTMSRLLAWLGSPPQGSSESHRAFQPHANAVKGLWQTLTSALQQDDEDAVGDFIDDESSLYANSVIAVQDSLRQSSTISTDTLYKSLRNGFDALHVTAQLINNLRSIRYTAQDPQPDTTVAMEVGGFVATAQLGVDAGVPNVPVGSTDIYLWNIARFGKGTGQLMEVMQAAAALLKVQSASFYFHAQPWVVEVYTKALNAQIVV